MIRFAPLHLIVFSWLCLSVSGCTRPNFGAGAGQGENCILGTQDCLCDLQGECQMGLICERDRCVPAPTESIDPKDESTQPGPDTEGPGAEETKDQESGEEDPGKDDASTAPETTGSDPEDTEDPEDSGDSGDPGESLPEDESSDVPEPSCDDGIANASESDIDCGGGECPGCANGLKCFVNADCLSNFCKDGICAKELGRPCKTDIECRDGNLCTRDRCVNKRCESSLRPDGYKCNDGEICTVQDRCVSGRCEGRDTRVLIETFSDPNNTAFLLDEDTDATLWEVAPARASNCNTVSGLGEDPRSDHTRDAANGVLGVVVGGCSEDQTMQDLDCVWTRYLDVSFFEKDIHFSFWRYINTPSFRGGSQDLRVRNYQYFRLQGDKTLYPLKSGWPDKVRDRKWEVDDVIVERNRVTGPVSFGICYKRIAGRGSFAGWSVDDVRVRQKDCVPKG